MSNESGSAELRTGILGSDATALLDLSVPARGGGACLRGGSDATPWVTRDGHLLLFRAPAFDADCEAIAAEGSDLYVVPLAVADGMPLGDAVALESVNLSGNDPTDPSFAPDLCTLYFGRSQRVTTRSRCFRAFAAEPCASPPESEPLDSALMLAR